jgi:hypothetical protein
MPKDACTDERVATRVKPSQHPEHPLEEPKAEQLNQHDIEIVPTRPESARKDPELVHADPAATWISLRNALGFVVQQVDTSQASV